jgi:hypothetical protein
MCRAIRVRDCQGKESVFAVSHICAISGSYTDERHLEGRNGSPLIREPCSSHFSVFVAKNGKRDRLFMYHPVLAKIVE